MQHPTRRPTFFTQHQTIPGRRGPERRRGPQPEEGNGRLAVPCTPWAACPASAPEPPTAAPRVPSLTTPRPHRFVPCPLGTGNGPSWTPSPFPPHQNTARTTGNFKKFFGSSWDWDCRPPWCGRDLDFGRGRLLPKAHVSRTRMLTRVWGTRRPAGPRLHQPGAWELRSLRRLPGPGLLASLESGTAQLGLPLLSLAASGTGSGTLSRARRFACCCNVLWVWGQAPRGRWVPSQACKEAHDYNPRV